MSTNDAEPATPGIICPECNHANRASARFCSQCGTDLSEQTIIVAPVRRDPPNSVASESSVEATPAPVSPSPDLVAAPADPFGAAPARGGSKPWIAIVVAALVLVAAAAWWFVGANRPAELEAGPKPRPEPAPAASAIAPAAQPPAQVAESAPAPEAMPASAAPPAIPPPVAATPDVASAPTAAPIDDTDTQRSAQAREKAAKAKAARDAKAKALQEQQAAQAAEQEAARKRADEARTRAAQAAAAKPALAPAPAATPRTAQDICAGRNAISQAVCESRECGKPEHAGEPYCRQLKAAEDRRSGAP